jgi:peptide methionine sulfoxide reductase MsrA
LQVCDKGTPNAEVVAFIFDPSVVTFRDLLHMLDSACRFACVCSQVCDKGTGHAEVVAVTFDPTVVTFRDLLDVFFTIHDPTTPNSQGADVGPQYRSIILYTNDEQKRVAEEVGCERWERQSVLLIWLRCTFLCSCFVGIAMVCI